MILRRYWPFFLVAFVYLSTSPYHRGLNNPNEMVRVYMAKAAVDHGTFAIDEVLREWGPVDDKAIRSGRLYSSKAPLQSLIGIPAYAIASPLLDALRVPVDKRTITHVLRILGSTVFGIAFAWLFITWARRRARELDAPESTGIAVGLGTALGTMLYPYALTFTGHLLAAVCAGSAYLGAIALGRVPAGGRRWRMIAAGVGFASGATPFAEYPAALVVLPTLIALFWMAPTWRLRTELAVWLGGFGLIPFIAGLAAHDILWGTPWKTGYAFLENASYAEVHREGFFGIGPPKFEALIGALFSPETGLFFFSPMLLAGLAALTRHAFARVRAPRRDEAVAFEPTLIPRALAIAGVLGVLLEVLFIAGHKGWRGGWTVGPRYIIAVAPLLGLWSIEALVVPKLRAYVLALASVSILTTGFASAIYPHLSDVFTNPLRSFVLPTYLRGETTYGLGHALGLSGGLANLVHVLPLTACMVYALLAGIREEPQAMDNVDQTTSPRSRDQGLGRSDLKRFGRRLGIGLALHGLLIALVLSIPEADPPRAAAENSRLWGFWEPRD